MCSRLVSNTWAQVTLLECWVSKYTPLCLVVTTLLKVTFCMGQQRISFCVCVCSTGLELRASHVVDALPAELLGQPFYILGYFQDRVSRTICLGWLQTVILMISAS
jgi:hypothetical protein